MNIKEKILLGMPLVFTIIIMIIINFAFIHSSEINVPQFEMLSNNYINFVSILIGFLITSISVIIGFLDKKILKFIVETKKESVLLANWITTVTCGIISVILLFCIAFNFSTTINTIHANIFLFFMLMFLQYLFFSLIYFFGIVRAVMIENIKIDAEMNTTDSSNIRVPKIE